MSTDTINAVPVALPFDDEGDAPVPFALTAAAHRAIDPSDVPTLRVVRDRSDAPEAPPTTDAPAAVTAHDDLRPAQARALRRSGMRIPTIAAAMGVDAALVTAWTADLASDRRGARTARPQVAAQRAPGGRRAAARTVRGREAAAAAGLAVALARVDADGTALTLTDDRPDVLGAALDALRGEVRIAPGAVRVACRVGAAVAADRIRAALVRALDVPEDRVVVGRWDGTGDAEAVEVRVRIADPRAVRAVDAWATAIAADRSVPAAAAGT